MRFRWGDCAIDREGRSLTRAGQLVPVQSLVLDLLLLLLRHRSRVVAEDVLRRELWPDAHVTDAALRRVLKEARRAIGDDGQRQEQIKTVRGRGVVFAPQVTVEDGWDTGFVGRLDLLSGLDRTLESVVEGIGAVSLIHGPAGIGKTRTLLELGARAEAVGFKVIRATGRAGAEPFHLWLEAADGAFAVEPRAPLESLEQRHMRFRAAAHALARTAQERPLLLVLDELQFADADSLALLRFVAPSLRAVRVWILGAYRSASGFIEGGCLRELSALAAEASSQVISLRGLETAELQAVVQHKLGLEVSRANSELLAERTHGNPLFALEIARSLKEEGHSLAQDLPTGVTARLARQVESLVERRTAALAPETRQLLETAALLGMEFDPAVLREAEGRPARALARALDEATGAGLLDPPLARRRSFAHPLVAEALLAQLATRPEERSARHLRIGEALERLGNRDPFLLARHFVAARPVIAAERALRYARAAGDEAIRRSAIDDAELWHRRTLELAEEAGLEPRAMAAVLLALGGVIVAGAGVNAARFFFRRAAQLALSAGDEEMLSRAALAYAHWPFAMTSFPEVLEWLEVARRAPSNDPSMRARIASRLAAELIVASASHRPRAEALLQEGVALARQQGDSRTLALVLQDQQALENPASEPRGTLRLAEETARHAREGGEIAIELRALCASVAAHLQLGDRAAAEVAFAECRSFAEHHPFAYSRVLVLGIEAMFELLDGRFDAARAAIDDCERIATSIGSTGIAAQIVGQRFWLAVEEQRSGESLPVLGAMRTRFPGACQPIAGIALAHALCGERQAALDALRVLVGKLAELPWNWARLPTLVFAAEAAFQSGAKDVAFALEPELARYGAVSAVAANGGLYHGAVAQALGHLAATAGRRRGAIEWFERALEIHTALRSPPWIARSARALEEARGNRGPMRLVV